MKEETRNRKQFVKKFQEAVGHEWLVSKMYQIMRDGKQTFDAFAFEMGTLLAETIMEMERVEKTGTAYHPLSQDLKKWASQSGSVYVGDQKISVQHPRIRGKGREIPLETYEKMKAPGGFGEELLAQVLRGLSARRYQDTVTEAGEAFGVSPSSVSRHIVAAAAEKLKAFKERSLTDFKPFALFLDGIHRAGAAFTVALGINLAGEKRVLGFWEGVTENAEVCEDLLRDLENRGLTLTKKILYVTDGGSGIIKALKQRFGKKLLHQRCALHKDRNIQRHLPKRYRKEAHRRFRTALEQNRYEDARGLFMELEKWLRSINESAADSLMEALEEILTVHRLKVPKLLRKTLYSTNPIDSLFSKVRSSEKNIKRYRGSGMAQRWLAAVLLQAEERFRIVEGYKQIPEVMAEIEILQGEEELKEAA
jgi:transposase-like protein